MTEKIYDKDPHITEFEATVLSCSKDPLSGNYAVILDRTSFFPEEGGQGCDRGFLNGNPVLHVSIDKNNVITHLLPVPLPVSEKVKGSIDYSQRFDYMQQHTGEHILSGLIHRKFGYDNVGFHLSSEYTTLDVNGSLTPEDILQLEQEANQAVFTDLPVKAYFPSAGELNTLTYRSKIEIEGPVRLVEIPGIDLCACCAPHVDTTGQIGLIKITQFMAHRGGMRLTIQCGMRALKFFDNCLAILNTSGTRLSVPYEKLPEAVEHLKQESFEKQQRINALQEKMLSVSLSSLPAPSVSPNAFLFTESMDTRALRNAVNRLTAVYPGFSGIFSGNDTDGYSFIIGAGKESDCTRLASGLREKLSARCGGSPQMIQGSVRAKKEFIDACLQEI